MSDAFESMGSTLILGPSDVGKTRATASALEDWTANRGVDGMVVLDFAPEVRRDDGTLLGGRLTRFRALPDTAWCGVLEAYAPRASATTQQEALEYARRNGANAATLLDTAPRPTALFVNDATIPFQHPAYPPIPLLKLLEDATYAVLNAFESTELGRDDLISRTERETREQLRTAVDRVCHLE